jgi:hypothetical protein
LRAHSGTSETPLAAIAFGLQQIKPAIDRLADRRLGLEGRDGMAGPPAHMIAIRGVHQAFAIGDDLPLKFHPAAIRVSANVTPFGAG